MCELLVFRLARESKSAIRSRPDKGGVLRIEEDDHQWGTNVLKSEKVRLIKLRGVPKKDMTFLIESYIATDGSIIERFKYTVDIDALELGKILKPTDSLTFTKTALQSAVKQRTVVDPRIIR